MKTLILVIMTLMVLSACGQADKSNKLFENCFNTKIDLEKSIVVSDSLGFFSFQVPDSTWKPIRLLDNHDNGLTVGDTSKGYIRLFNVNQSEYSSSWNWAEEQKNVEIDYNVIETGEILFHDQKCRYNIVLFEKEEPQMITFYFTILDTINERQYTLNLTTENHPEFKDRFCEMRSIVESFRIK